MTTISPPPAITADQTINAIVERHPWALPILARFGLDTCCGGGLPLSTAAAHHGLRLADLLAALAAPAEQPR